MVRSIGAMGGVWLCLVWMVVLFKIGLSVVDAQNQTAAAEGTGSLDPAQLGTTGFGVFRWGDGFVYDQHSNVCIVQTQLVVRVPGVVYSFWLSQTEPLLPTYGIPTQIHIIQVRVGNSSTDLTVIKSLPIRMLTPTNIYGNIYSFNYTQLFEVQPGDLFGYCFGGRPFLFLDTITWQKTTNYVWTPTSYARGHVNSSSVTVETNAPPFNILFYQWNVNLTDLNLTKFEAFRPPHASLVNNILVYPDVEPLDGIDPFDLPTVLLGDTVPADGILEKSNISNRCVIPNVPVTEPTLVYAFSGSSLDWNGHGYTIKLIHVRMVNPPTIILTNSTMASVKLIQSVDINIGSASPRFEYDLPGDQFFSLQAGDFIGYCVDDHNSYTTTPTYFQYQSRPLSDGHSVFSFHLGPGNQSVTLNSEVHDFNARGWKNVTRSQLNGVELQAFFDRAGQNNAYLDWKTGGFGTLVATSGPFTNDTTPILNRLPLPDPSASSSTGGLIPSGNSSLPSHSVDPTKIPADSFLYGYEYVDSDHFSRSDGYTYTVPDAGWYTNATSHCVLFDYRLDFELGDSPSGIIYSIQAGQLPPTTQPTTLTIIIAQAGDTNQNHSSFRIKTAIDILIEPSDQVTQLLYYFSLDQLIELSADDYFGMCFSVGLLSQFDYVEPNDLFVPYLYEWSNTNPPLSVAGATAHNVTKNQRALDLQMHGWSSLTLNQLDLNAANEFLSSARSASGGSARVLIPTTSPSGGLSSGGRLALIICMVLFGVGILIAFMIIRNRRRLASPAPVSPAPHPPHTLNADIAGGLSPPKPGLGEPVSSFPPPSAPMMASVQNMPPPSYQPQPQPIYYSPASPTQPQPIASPSSRRPFVSDDVEMELVAPPPPYAYHAAASAVQNGAHDVAIRVHLDRSAPIMHHLGHSAVSASGSILSGVGKLIHHAARLVR